MESKSLYLKYRPQTFDEMVGNQSVIAALRSIIARDEGRPHAFLFTGESGTGKTTCARILASELGCDPSEVREYNAANLRGIDTIRDIAAACRYKPRKGSCSVYIIDECHSQTNEAQNAQLKLLEDTPKHIYFILCSTNPEKILKTVKTRCTTLEMKSLIMIELMQLIKGVTKQEGVSLPMEAYREIARKANGSPRQALVILDKVIDITDVSEMMEAIKNTMVVETDLQALCRLLIENQTGKWKQVATLLAAYQGDPEQTRWGIMNYISTVLINTGDPRLARLLNLFSDSYIYNGKAGLVRDCFAACVIFDEK